MPNKISFLVYQGGRGGEFLHSLLTRHNSLDSVSLAVETCDWDPNINRYKTRANSYGRLFNQWAFDNKKVTLSDFDIDPNKRYLIRSHNALPFESVFGESRVVIVYSQNYNNFFSTLYWIKHLLQPNSTKGDLLAWEDIVQSRKSYYKSKNITSIREFLQDSLDANKTCQTPNNWYDPKPILAYAKSTYKNCFYLDIDELLIYNNFSIYNELCDFLSLEPIQEIRREFQAYHKCNLEVLAPYGIQLVKDSADLYSQIDVNVTKIINRLDLKKVKSTTSPYTYQSLSLTPLAVIQYTAGRGGEFLNSYLSTHSGFRAIETEFDPNTNSYRVKDHLRALLNNGPRNKIDWKELVKSISKVTNDKNTITTSYFSSDNHVELAGWFKTNLMDRGAKVILPISKKHNAFFTALAFIKYWFATLDRDSAWQKFQSLNPDNEHTENFYKNFDTIEKKSEDIPIWKIYSLAYFGEVLSLSDWYDRTGFEVKEKQYMRIISRLSRSFVLDLDRLFFDKNYETYHDLCKFLNTVPRDDHKEVFELYHMKNISLIKNLDLTTEDDSEFKKWVLDYYEQLTK